MHAIVIIMIITFRVLVNLEEMSFFSTVRCLYYTTTFLVKESII